MTELDIPLVDSINEAAREAVSEYDDKCSIVYVTVDGSLADTVRIGSDELLCTVLDVSISTVSKTIGD